MTPHVGHPAFPLDVASIASHARKCSRPPSTERLRVHPGGEIHPAVAGWLASEELDLIAHGPREARWVLVEVPFSGIDSPRVDSVRSIRRRGFEVVVAHPSVRRACSPGVSTRCEPSSRRGAQRAAASGARGRSPPATTAPLRSLRPSRGRALARRRWPPYVATQRVTRRLKRGAPSARRAPSEKCGRR